MVFGAGSSESARFVQSRFPLPELPPQYQVSFSLLICFLFGLICFLFGLASDFGAILPFRTRLLPAIGSARQVEMSENRLENDESGGFSPHGAFHGSMRGTTTGPGKGGEPSIASVRQ
jgi:hypothetical protein